MEKQKGLYFEPKKEIKLKYWTTPHYEKEINLAYSDVKYVKGEKTFE